MRRTLVLLVALASVLAACGQAAAMTVLWSGVALDGSGRAGELVAETTGAYKDGKFRAFGLALTFEVDGELFSLATTVRERKKDFQLDGYDLRFDVAQRTLTLTAQNADALPPYALASITFAFASFPGDKPNLNDLLKLFERTEITSVMMTTADGREIDTVFGVPPVPVPVPGAAWAFATGLGLFGAATGGARRNRTADLLNAIQALYQLSYSPSRQRAAG